MPSSRTGSSGVEAGEARETLDRLAFGHQTVLYGTLIGIAQRHAADHFLRLRYVELLVNDRVHVGERLLRARVQAGAPRRDHELTQKNPEIDPASDFEIRVERED